MHLFKTIALAQWFFSWTCTVRKPMIWIILNTQKKEILSLHRKGIQIKKLFLRKDSVFFTHILTYIAFGKISPQCFRLVLSGPDVLLELYPQRNPNGKNFML